MVRNHPGPPHKNEQQRDMAELVDALALGAGIFDVRVRLSLSRPNKPDDKQ